MHSWNRQRTDKAFSTLLHPFHVARRGISVVDANQSHCLLNAEELRELSRIRRVNSCNLQTAIGSTSQQLTRRRQRGTRESHTKLTCASSTDEKANATGATQLMTNVRQFIRFTLFTLPVQPDKGVRRISEWTANQSIMCYCLSIK